MQLVKPRDNHWDSQVSDHYRLRSEGDNALGSVCNQGAFTDNSADGIDRRFNFHCVMGFCENRILQ